MLHKHEPVSEEVMTRVSPNDTICETLRGVYSKVDDEDVKLQLRIATAKAKAMTAKLQEYHRTWHRDFWGPNEKVSSSYAPMIDVLFLCWDDNCNTGYRFMQCAKYLGLNAVMFKGKPHPFGYPVQAPLHPSLMHDPINFAPTTIMAPGMETLINSARVVHLMHSTHPMAYVNWAKKKVVVQHGGTVYRQNPGKCNAVFNEVAAKTVIQCPDLLGMGAKNEQWIYYPVDTSLLRPVFKPQNPGKIIVGHFPSNPEVKGTDLINRAVRRAKKINPLIEYAGTDKKVSWMENLQRMAACDVIVEGCNVLQNGKAYGEWGNTAIEASALGCGVVTHSQNCEAYEKEFGKFGPLIANDLETLVNHLIKMTLESVDQLKTTCHKWAKKNHSIPATANRLWDKVYKDFF